jgi:3-phenylpropionate/cinnamic acid dioxygenase small subunit
MSVDRGAVESFLYREARLMDESAYDEWLSLWAAEAATYWVPCNRDDVDPLREISIIYDDRAGLEGRIERLKSGAAFAQDPKSRMRRLVSNVEIVEESSNGEVVVHSNFDLTEVRRGERRSVAGRTMHRLRHRGGGYEIVTKKVMLVDNDEPIRNLTFLL